MNEEKPDLAQLFREMYRVSTPREMLISALAAATSDAHALSILHALDEYLDDDIGRVPMPSLPRSNLTTEIKKIQKERDEAVARAEKAERGLRVSIDEKTRAEAVVRAETLRKKKKRKR